MVQKVFEPLKFYVCFILEHVHCSGLPKKLRRASSLKENKDEDGTRTKPGPGCSKLTTLLVNVSLKF